jgi:hypothetical protein
MVDIDAYLVMAERRRTGHGLFVVWLGMHRFRYSVLSFNVHASLHLVTINLTTKDEWEDGLPSLRSKNTSHSSHRTSISLLHISDTTDWDRKAKS